MRDDFNNDIEEFMELRPNPTSKKFSFHLWNKHLVPTCRALAKTRKVNRLRAGFSDGKGKEYYITIWTDRSYDYGATFIVCPISGGVTWRGRDLHDNTYFQDDGWDTLITTVKDEVMSDPLLMAHVR